MLPTHPSSIPSRIVQLGPLAGLLRMFILHVLPQRFRVGPAFQAHLAPELGRIHVVVVVIEQLPPQAVLLATTVHKGAPSVHGH